MSKHQKLNLSIHWPKLWLIMIYIFRAFLLTLFVFEMQDCETVPLNSFEDPAISTKSFLRYLSLKEPPSPNSSLCDGQKILEKAADVNDACDEECQVIAESVSAIYRRFPHSPPIQFLHDACGLTTGGECDFFISDYFPICKCLSLPSGPEGHQTSSYAFYCRHGFTVLHKIVNAAIYARHRRHEKELQENQPVSAKSPSDIEWVESSSFLNKETTDHAGTK